MITHFWTSKYYWRPEIEEKGRVTNFFFSFFVGKSDGEGRKKMNKRIIYPPPHKKYGEKQKKEKNNWIKRII